MFIETDFFDIDNEIEPTKGSILISEPFNNDLFFKRSVVLITEHNNTGSLGFVLNRPLNVKLNDVLKSFPPCKSIVSGGGPVNTNSVFYMHKLGDKLPKSFHIRDSLYWGGDWNALKMLVENNLVKNNQLRFFVGYAGWQPKQLQQELKQKYWAVSNCLPEKIMEDTSKNMWRKALLYFGDKYKTWLNVPEVFSNN